MPLAYVAWRASTTYRVVVPVRQAGNQFLGSFKGLQIRALSPLPGQQCPGPSKEKTAFTVLFLLRI